MTSVSGEVFSPQDLISKFQIYGRHNEPVPAGVAKLQVRNFQITIDPVKIASMPDRLSYSANLLFDWKVFANAESYEVAYSQDPALPADKTRISKTDRPFLLSDSALAPGIWHYQVTALPQQKISSRMIMMIQQQLPPKKPLLLHITEPPMRL